jgi:signal transduction histidine kinase
MRRIVNRHGGTVELDSQRDRGTTVLVRLPALDDVTPDPAPAS